MKKLSLLAIAFAAIALASCGNKASSNASDEDTIVKTFEQEQLEEAVKMNLDSIANAISEKKFTPLSQALNNGKITLTDEEKKEVPTYLIEPSIADALQTISQKYAALIMLYTDKGVAELYGMNTGDYDKAIKKLAADINDPALENVDDSKPFNETEKQIYADMEKNGRINFFWIASCAATVENLYIASMNADKFLQGYDDEAVASLSYRIVLLLDAFDRLSVYDAEIQGVADAIQPLKKINAITVSELKKELEEVKEELAISRKALIE